MGSIRRSRRSIIRLFNKIDVTRVAKSYVLSLSVSSRDPAKAARGSPTRWRRLMSRTRSPCTRKSVQQAAAFFEDQPRAVFAIRFVESEKRGRRFPEGA